MKLKFKPQYPQVNPVLGHFSNTRDYWRKLRFVVIRASSCEGIYYLCLIKF